MVATIQLNPLLPLSWKFTEACWKQRNPLQIDQNQIRAFYFGFQTLQGLTEAYVVAAMRQVHGTLLQVEKYTSKRPKSD